MITGRYRFLFLLLFILSVGRPNQAQTLSYEQFLLAVYTEHPLAKKIKLLESAAQQQLQYAKGGFDPKLETGWGHKQFKGKTYFSILNAHLKVPTWIGLAVETGYNYTTGDYLNPENKLPPKGQAYLGLSIPLLKGLWTDERRTAIQQARLLNKSSAIEIQTALNDLLYRAAKDYWEWAGSYNSLLEIERSLDLAQEQFSAIKAAYEQGDKPAIDTLKSYIQIQERTVLLQAATLEVQKNQRIVSTFLWGEDQPLNMSPTTQPMLLRELDAVALDTTVLQDNLIRLKQHPKLQKYAFKLQHLALERKLKTNNLLPKLDLKYNFLSTNHVLFFDGVGASAPIENYKLGIKLSMPILLRKERASLKLNTIKQKETNYQQQAEQQDLSAKIENYFATVQNHTTQIGLLEQMVANYESLLEAEQLKLRMGESSLFVVNTRQNQLLQARLKLIKQQTSYLKARTSFYWIIMNLDDRF